MSLETQIAALVAAANNLTGTVNGKVSEIDAALVAAGVTYNAQLNDLKNRMPRLLVTRNLVMQDADSNGMPDSWGYHASVSLAKLRTVSQRSQATGRPAEDIALLAEIEADVREVYPDFDILKYEYYRQDFTAWQMLWSQGPVGDYLAFPYAADFGVGSGVSSVPLNSYLTVGGFVKLVSGDVNGSWATGRQLGKWRWCSHVIESAKAFGAYANLHPIRYSAEGVVRVALAGACTGVISHPSEWFAQLSLS